MAIFTDGPVLEPDSKDIHDFHGKKFSLFDTDSWSGLGARLGASAAATWEDSPVHQLAGIAELEQAGGAWPDFGEIASGTPTGPQITDAAKPAVPRMDIIEANDRVKKAGLAPHLKLPDQPDIAPAQLTIMMDRARRRLELETTVERGPQGFIPGALDIGTSFLVGAVDPLNLASAFVPVMGELRYGKLLADAGASALSRGAVRAGVGAAQGAAGQALLEPLDWYSHTQDGRDFGMSDVLHNLMFGAVLGGGLQAGGGAIADVWRGRKGRPLYPYGPGEPLEHVPQRVATGPEIAPIPHPEEPSAPALAAPEAAAPERIPAPAEAAPETLNEPAPAPSPEVQTINDLPARAHEDAMRGAISDLINGVPVRAGEMLESAAGADPRIAESFAAHGRNSEISASGARAAVFDDVHAKLLDAGMSPDEAGANAALVAARYAARAERLGGVENAVDLYRSEGIGVRAGEFGDVDGRAFAQARNQGPDLFAAREAEGQQSLPGTERIGQGELAQRRTDAPLKPGVAQKPLDVGLFGDDAKQKSFFQSQPQAQPFYSAVDRAVTSAKQDKASPEQWLGTLKNAPGVKPEEMQWLGLEDWLKQQRGSVSKNQVQEYVRANAIEVKEVNKGRIPLSAMDEVERRAVQTDAAAETINVRMIEKYGGLAEAFGKWTDAERAEFDRVHGEAAAAGAALSERNQDHADGLTSRGNNARYSSYVLPGGENYRELLLTLPEKEHPDLTGAYAINERLREKYGSLTEAFQRWTEDEREEFDRLHGAAHKAPIPQTFTSSHWDERNVLAHIRFDDRISNGKKTLHVAEVQSDWHQAGKRKGYDTRPNLTEDQRAALLAERDQIVRDAVDAKQAIDLRYNAEFERRGLRNASREEKEAFWAPLHDELAKDPREIRYSERINELNAALGEHQTGVPDAPFKTTWPELSMKRMIRYAAEHGYDRISWDTGTTNAERYDLSKHIKEIEYIKNADGSYRLGIADKEGEPVGALPGMDVNKMTLDQVERALGKEVAEKIKNEEGKRLRGHDGLLLENVDLKVGGEGMAGFYDRILPATVNKLVKKFGAKVEQGHVPTGVGKDERWALRDATDQGEGEIVSTHATRAEAEREAEDYGGGVEIRELPVGEHAVHSLDLTPDLRKAALEQGFPLFQGGGDTPRGRITLVDNAAIIDLYKSADASTFMHETGHLWLDELMRDAARGDAPDALKADRDTVLAWLGVKDPSEIATAQHEQWAEGFEQYLKTGEAPSNALAKAFAQFKQWITEIYQALARSGQQISPEIKAVMDRLLASESEIAERADGANVVPFPKSSGAAMDNDVAWRALAQTVPEFDVPEIIAASKAADEIARPPTKLDERVTASEKADAFAKQMYDMFAHRMPEQDRTRLDDLIKRIDDDHEARNIAIVRGGSCLFGVV